MHSKITTTHELDSYVFERYHLEHDGDDITLWYRHPPINAAAAEINGTVTPPPVLVADCDLDTAADIIDAITRHQLQGQRERRATR